MNTNYDLKTLFQKIKLTRTQDEISNMFIIKIQENINTQNNI